LVFFFVEDAEGPLVEVAREDLGTKNIGELCGETLTGF